MNTRGQAIARLLFIDVLGSILWFPAWWYTKGLLHVMEHIRQDLRYRWQAYGMRIWVKNFFVPMYGQYDLTGRLVSVFMRGVVLIGRLIAFGIEALVYGGAIVCWIVFPIGISLLLISNITVGVIRV